MKLTPEERLAFEEAVMRKRLSMERKPNTPASRPDVAGGGIRQRLLDACVGKPAKVPWPHRLLHDAADHIEVLEARQVKLEAVVEGVRDCADKEHLENRVALAGARTGAPILTANIPAKLWNPVLKALAALGDGDE